jgi:sulfate permease, SulP family
VLERVRSRPDGLHVVVCDLSNSPYLDLAGTRMLARLFDELKTMNIELLVVEAHATERDILRAEGLDKLVGPIHRETSLADALADLKKENPQKNL